jgi:ankyrin repeat protein
MTNSPNRIHYACREGNLDRLRDFLRETPHLVNVPDGEGDSPLIIAVRNNHSTLVEHLVSFNIAQVNVNFVDLVSGGYSRLILS